MDNAQRVRQRRRKLLRKEPTNYTLRARMGQYSNKKRGESDNERMEMRSGTMQTNFNKIRDGASTVMKDTKKESMPSAKGKPTPPKRPNNKDDVAKTTGEGKTGTQSGPSPKGNQKKLDTNKDGKLTAEDFRLLRNRKFRRDEPEKYKALLKKRDGTSDVPKSKGGGRVLTRKKNLERLKKLRSQKKQEEEKKEKTRDQRGRSR